MATIIEKYWWALMLRGVLAIAFGGGALFCQSISTLGYLFGTFALAQGVLSVLPAFSKSAKGKTLAGIEGTMGVLIALFTLLGASVGALLWPGVTNVSLLIWIILWIAVTGVVAIALVIRLRGGSPPSWYFGLSAALCVLFTILLIFRRAEGALGNAKVMGVFCILYGVALILIARKAKSRQL